MARNSSMQVQHACGTCGTLWESIETLSEHVKQHATPDVSSGESDTQTFNAWSDADTSASTRRRARGSSTT